MFDSLRKPIDYVAEKYNYKPNCDEMDLLEFVYSSEDKELQKMMKKLANNVPYRLISPFFTDELRGQKDHEKDRMITEMSVVDDKCLYKIIKSDDNKIVLNKG